MNNKSIVILVLVFMAGYAISHFHLLPFFKEEQSAAERQTIEEEPAGQNYDYRKNKLKDLVSVKPANAETIRKKLTKIIFGTADLPALLPDSVFEITDTLYDDISNLKTIEKFTIIQQYNIRSVGYIFHPLKTNHRLFIYHQGHNGDFILGKAVIGHFVNKGFTVYAFCMPLIGKNNQPVVSIDKIGTFKLSMEAMESHELTRFLDKPIRFFINPVVSMINYAQSKNFKDISMCGISGGGWTTTVAAAVDPRINYSFPVAGTYPMYVKLNSPPKSYGDFEQVWTPLYSQVNYLDMYILGATGKNRYQVQMLNRHDPCCFDGTYFEHYEAFIKKRVNTFEYGSFEIISDTENREHCVSAFMINAIDKQLTHNQ